ncbi:MAG TPA: hypothetical protein VN772_05765 [Solirubrobacteraceae bacterium]|nr:hypothetical protein [Solirubrobacteraceae bacterium]
MRVPIAATAATAAALVAASMLGVASAEAPTSSPARTVSVEGVSIVPISQTADAASATAAYRAGMAAAVADGQSKAEFLASKVGASLGPAQSVVEGGGYISCVGTEEAEYQGAQPDFGSPGGGVVSPLRVSSGVAAPTAGAPAIRKPAARHRKRGKTTAGKAAASGCTLSAQVSLAYVLD